MSEQPPQERRELPPEPRIEVSSGTRGRCPYCHDDLQPAAKLVACEICGTEHHADCFSEGCSVFGCPGAPHARAPLTPLRILAWTFSLTFAALMGVLIGGESQEIHRLGGQLVGAVVLMTLTAWLLRKVDRANAAARLELAPRAPEAPSRVSTLEEALDTLGLSGTNPAQRVLDGLAADAPPLRRFPPGALPPSACGECGEHLEPPEGKEEPDWFCYHCGAELQPVDEGDVD